MKEISILEIVRGKNQAEVLRLLLSGQCRYRSELADRMGLTRPAITHIVGELIDCGFLQEEDGEIAQGQRGRKPIALFLSSASPLLVGFFLQREQVTVVCSDLAGEIHFRKTVAYPRKDALAVLPKLFLQLFYEAKQGTERKLLAICVTSFGPLDISGGRLLSPRGIYSAEEALPLKAILEGETGLPVFLTNDASAGALAEKLYGRAKEEDAFIYLSLVDGVGTGFYLDGRLYEGPTGQNGEIGHSSIDFHGEECICGNRGCLELYTNLSALRKEARAKAVELPDSPVFSPDSTLFQWIDLAAEYDTAALWMLNRYADYLSAALNSLLLLLDVQKIYVGNAAGEGNDLLEKLLQTRLNKLSQGFRPQKTVVISRSALNLDGPLYGAIALLLERMSTGCYIIRKE